MKGKIFLSFALAIVLAAGMLFTHASPTSAIVYVTTNPASGITSSDATLNGTNESSAADGHSFWVSLASFSTASPTIPAGVYSTPDLGPIGPGTSFTASLSSITTTGVPGNLPAVTPGTTYYFAAWTLVGGTWYPGEILTFTTAAETPACSGSSSFDSFTLGTVNGQDGWTVTGPYDQEIVANIYGYPTFGCQSLRLSDSVTSGSFGDQVFAKPEVNGAGETSSTAGSFSEGVKQNHFETQFDIGSTMQAYQPGMHTSVSPDRGDGSRMSYLRFEDAPGGINVFFDDVQGTSNPANFVETQIAANLSRSVPHTIKLTMDFADGPSNDVVNVYIDGTLVHTGTSWENYYRYDSEAAAEQSPRIVKTVLFRQSGAATPANAGNGFLFDNYSSAALTVVPPPPVTVTIVKFIDGAHADANSANSLAFPMSATWSAANIGAGSGSYNLSTVGFNNPNPYEATTALMTSGADYTSSELTDGNTVGAQCADGKPYALLGYTSGDTLAEAQAAAMSATAPVFTGLITDKFIIVWNKDCRPKLTVVKYVINDNGGTSTVASFPLFVDGNPVVSGAQNIYAPGSYTVSETNQAGYQDVFGGDCDSGGLVTLSPGDEKTCTVTNDDIAPSLTLDKTVVNDDTMAKTESDWTLSASGPSPLSGPGTAGSSDVQSDSAFMAGTYTLSEEGPEGYYASQWSCVKNNQAPVLGNVITLGLGETAACSIINNDIPLPPANACGSLTPPPGYALISGTPGNDKVEIPPYTMFVGNGGNDKVTGKGSGYYIVCTAGGKDIITIGKGVVVIDAGNGANTITLGNGSGFVTTGSDKDVITTGNGSHTIDAGNGANVINTGNGNQFITTGSGNDTIITGSGSDVINAGNGKNKVLAGAGADSITTGSGNDFISGGSGFDTCSAGGGTNLVFSCP